MSNQSPMIRYYLLFCNSTMMIGWARTFRVVFRNWSTLQDPQNPVCQQLLEPYTQLALWLSCLELLNAAMGVTRSKPHQVLLFAGARSSVEFLITPLLGDNYCAHVYHLYTVTFWSFGDMIRFGCFTLDNLVPQATLAKKVRYTVGPIMFPLGILGETLIVYEVARLTWHPFFLVATVLWPVFGIVLMRQLLKQRRRFWERLVVDSGSASGDASKAKIKAV